MSITDELREWVTDHYSGWKSKQAEGIAIADRIDAEHERRMEERADRYSELRTILKERYIELPVDADNVPWSIGDRDENGNVVTELHLFDDGWWVCVGEIYIRPDRRRHHHAPTVDDVLREFICDHEEGVRDEVDLIAEYASKLKLAEGEDA